MSPAGVSQVTPGTRLAAGQLVGSAVVPQVTSLASVPSSVCHAMPISLLGSARPVVPSMLPPRPRRTRRMFGVAPTVGADACQPMYSMRGAIVNPQLAGTIGPPLLVVVPLDVLVEVPPPPPPPP